MRIAIFDDNETDSEKIGVLVQNWIGKQNPDKAAFFRFHDDRQLLFETMEGHFYDLYFLDIMTEKSSSTGFRLAEIIRSRDNRAFIVFTTNTPDFMNEAFEVDTFRYLIKPVTQGKIDAILDKVNAALQTIKTRTGVFRGIDETLIIPYAEIVYIESQSIHHRALVYQADGCCSVISLAGTTFTLFAKEQLTDLFFQCHRGYVINLNYLTNYDNECITLCHSIRIPLSRNRKNEFLSAFIQYHKEMN